jgi:hypothetical protein
VAHGDAVILVHMMVDGNALASSDHADAIRELATRIGRDDYETCGGQRGTRTEPYSGGEALIAAAREIAARRGLTVDVQGESRAQRRRRETATVTP